MPRSLKLTAQVLALGLVAALLSLLGWRLTHQGERKTSGPAPGFTLPRLDGHGDVQLAAYRGRAVVLNFWASWCAPCKDEAPNLEAAWRRWRSRGVVVVGVDSQDFSGDARKFGQKFQLTYPLVHDGTGKVRSAYGVDGFPETFFVDRQGRIVANHIGPASQQSLDEKIRAALSS